MTNPIINHFKKKVNALFFFLTISTTGIIGQIDPFPSASN